MGKRGARAFRCSILSVIQFRSLLSLGEPPNDDVLKSYRNNCRVYRVPSQTEPGEGGTLTLAVRKLLNYSLSLPQSAVDAYATDYVVSQLSVVIWRVCKQKLYNFCQWVIVVSNDVTRLESNIHLITELTVEVGRSLYSMVFNLFSVMMTVLVDTQ